MSPETGQTLTDSFAGPAIVGGEPMHGSTPAGAMTVLLRHRRWFSTTFLLVALAVFALGYPRRPHYTSITSFVTEPQRGGAVSDIAAQFGFAINANQSSAPSPLFYPELFKSQQFMEAVVDAKYPSGSGNDSALKSLPEIFRIRESDARVRRELARRALDDAVTVLAAPQTGVVKISVTAEQPQVAQAIARVFLEKAQEFNIHTRQSRAAAERAFVERRLSEVRADQRAAEDRLQQFLQENRDGFLKSPTLQFTRSRLEQAVTLQQQITLSLAQSFEQAKIDEVRDTPVLTVLSQPQLPALPDPRGRFRLLLISTFVGLGAGVIALYLRSQLVDRATAGAVNHAELAYLAGELKSDLKHGRVLRAIFGTPTTESAATSVAATSESASRDDRVRLS